MESHVQDNKTESFSISYTKINSNYIRLKHKSQNYKPLRRKHGGKNLQNLGLVIVFQTPHDIKNKSNKRNKKKR